jgi:hypothetical protein
VCQRNPVFSKNRVSEIAEMKKKRLKNAKNIDIDKGLKLLYVTAYSS